MSLRRITLPGQLRQRAISSQFLYDLISSASDDITGLHSFLDGIKGIENTPSFGSLNPLVYGLTGDYIVVNKNATSGPLFNTIENRPKTINEAISDISEYIEGPIDSESVNDLFLLVKNRIGSNLFLTDNMFIDTQTLDGRVSLLANQVKQIASDVFNAGKLLTSELDENIYPIGASTGTQTRSKPLIDMIDKLYAIHGGLSQSNHKHLDRKFLLSSCIEYSNFVPNNTSVNFVPFNGKQIVGLIPSFAVPLSNIAYIDRMIVKIGSNNLNASTKITLFVNGVSKHELTVPLGVNSIKISENINIKLNDLDEVYFNVDTTDTSSGGIHIANITISIKEQIEG